MSGKWSNGSRGSILSDPATVRWDRKTVGDWPRNMEMLRYPSLKNMCNWMLKTSCGHFIRQQRDWNKLNKIGCWILGDISWQAGLSSLTRNIYPILPWFQPQIGSDFMGISIGCDLGKAPGWIVATPWHHEFSMMMNRLKRITIVKHFRIPLWKCIRWSRMGSIGMNQSWIPHEGVNCHPRF